MACKLLIFVILFMAIVASTSADNGTDASAAADDVIGEVGDYGGDDAMAPSSDSDAAVEASLGSPLPGGDTGSSGEATGSLGGATGSSGGDTGSSGGATGSSGGDTAASSGPSSEDKGNGGGRKGNAAAELEVSAMAVGAAAIAAGFIM